jgi:hypothetical protein
MDTLGMKRSIFKACALLLGLFALLTGSGCKPVAQVSQIAASATADKPAAQAVNSVMVDSVNYMHERGAQYTLYDLSQTPPAAVGGAIVNMLGTGGEKGCCLNLPTAWKPGMKVQLKWEEADRKQTFPEKYERILEIPKYAHPADLYVVFYPNHEVEVVVSAGEPGSASWQGRIKQAPWDFCVANNGRKTCKLAVPKLFDTDGMQGFCTSTKAPDFPKENFDGELLCASAMRQCMDDFEDEPYCKGILWGAMRK